MPSDVDAELLRVGGGWLYVDRGTLFRLASDVNWHEPVGDVDPQQLLARLKAMPDFSGPSQLNVDFLTAVLLGGG